MKKALIILLVVSMMTASIVGLVSANEIDTVNGAEIANPYYRSVTGTVIGVEELEHGIRIEIAMPSTDRDARAYLNITDETVFPFDDEVEIGDTVTAYFLANAPMIMIYPPQYTVAVLVNGVPEGLSVAVDRFNAVNGAYLAQGGALQFTVNEDTEIVLADGTDFTDGEFAGRRIVVVYGPSTRSIPAQTTAIKLIVMFEDAVHPIGMLTPEDLDGFVAITPLPLPIDPVFIAGIDASGWPILVNGTQITAPDALQPDGETMVMIPLRAVAEALGYDVVWDGATGSVRLGAAINLRIGSNEVNVGRMETLTFSIAAVLIDGVTYVPLDFFRLIGLNNAFAFEGQIVIDRAGEIMH